MAFINYSHKKFQKEQAKKKKKEEKIKNKLERKNMPDDKGAASAEDSEPASNATP